MRQQSTGRRVICLTVAGFVTIAGLAHMSAQVRAGRRGAVAAGDDRAAAAGPRGAAVKGEDGYAAAGRRGAVVSGDEGYAAVGRRGNVVTGDDIDVDGVAVGRRGAVVVGEEGAAAVGRYGGVVVGDRYESYDAWRAVAAVGTGIAIGTMLAKPPAAATPVVVIRIDLLLSRQRVLHARDDEWGGDVPGRRASGRRDHHDTSGWLQQCERRRRGVLAVWPDVLLARVDGISGGRAELRSTIDGTDKSPAVAFQPDRFDRIRIGQLPLVFTSNNGPCLKDRYRATKVWPRTSIAVDPGGIEDVQDPYMFRVGCRAGCVFAGRGVPADRNCERPVSDRGADKPGAEFAGKRPA